MFSPQEKNGAYVTMEAIILQYISISNQQLYTLSVHSVIGKEIEENNRMGNTRDLFKKIRDTKGIFHAKMGSIKDRNGRDLTEAEDIKKRWQEYTEELYKKDLHDLWVMSFIITMV